MNADIKKLFQSRHGMYGENGFDHEFSYIERKTEKDLYFGDYKSALQPCNHLKNRYSNVLPFERTRVVLSKDGTDGSDYINASYINGQIPGSERAYICTQGPTKNTIDDFWKMVWEQTTTVIVMLTKEVENTKPKCARYWPEEHESEMYGRLRVNLLHVDLSGEIMIRTMLLEDMQLCKTHEISNVLLVRGISSSALLALLKKRRDCDKERLITQFQYISWPDHGLPVSTTAFLDLVGMVDVQKKTGPVIVHCSAGIGRSGTFCTVHSTITKFRHDLSVKPEVSPAFDILHTVIYMRQQRPGMVQTKEQYMFCYLSIDEEASQITKKLNPLGRGALSYSH